MKNSNLFIIGLSILVIFLIYQVFDLKQNMNNKTNEQQNLVQMTGGLTLSQFSNLSGNTSDGFWLYKDDEKQIYYFKYDKDSNQIVKIMRSIYD